MDRNLPAYLELYNLSAYEYENAVLEEVSEDLGDLHEVDDELASRVQFRSESYRSRCDQNREGKKSLQRCTSLKINLLTVSQLEHVDDE